MRIAAEDPRACGRVPHVPAPPDVRKTSPFLSFAARPPLLLGRTSILLRPAAALAIAALVVAAGSAGAGVARQNAETAPPAPLELDSTHLSHLEWRSIGPGGVGGRIVDIVALASDPQTIWVGTAYSGAWKSTDGGISWSAAFERENRVAVGGIALAPTNPNVVWIGTGEPNTRNLVSSSWGDGVYKSEDGGKSWKNMGLPLSLHIGRIRIHPDDEDVVFVSVLGSLWHDSPEHNEARGLWRTVDGGASWEKILSAGEHGGIVDLELDPRDPDLMYAASWQRERRDWSWFPRGDESALFRSTDGGDSWERLTSGLPQGDLDRFGVSVCRSRPDVVYAITGGPEGGVFRSDDRGASWERTNSEVRSSHYYGQLRCDPNDPDRVYALSTQFMVSHDGGRTFENEMAGKPVHVDHHALWIDPNDSEHLVLGNDGGVYLSNDRGGKWRFVADLPITQFYEIGVDMREPFYTVCGGTQDNNTYCGPSATRNTDGIVNDDWYRTVGGDGFYARVDPTDNRTVYSESQNGGLVRFDAVTGERKRIKPADPADLRPIERRDDEAAARGGGRGDEGGGERGGGRGARGRGEPQATQEIDEYRWNWSAPLLLSTWDPATIYFGSQVVFRSRDRGDTWEVISPDLTRGLEYESPMNDYGTLRVIVESPLRRGVLAAGTDDGLVHVTEDGGQTWSTTEALPGVPELALVRRIVLSAHDPDTIYVASSAHEYNDFRPFVLRSTDLGRTWESITANLPEDSPVRALAEHPRNPDLLFVGTEHGVWASLDGGGRWLSIDNNLPTVSVHDMLVHPRDNDLVIGTHGRGIWILDDITVLEEMTPEVLAAEGKLLTPRPALQFNPFNRGRNSRGSTYFRAPNPPDGAILDYFVDPRAAEAPIELTLHDPSGQRVRRLDVPQGSEGTGFKRVVWDLRHDPTWVGSDGEEGGFGGGTVRGPWVLPGTYEARLRVGDAVSAVDVRVVADRLVEISDDDRRLWHDLQVSLAEMLAVARAASASGRVLDDVMEQTRAAVERGGAGRDLPADVGERVERVAEQVDELLRELGEISRGAGQLYGALQGSTSRPSGQELVLAQRAFERLERALEQLQRLLDEDMPPISGLLDDLGLPWTLGRPVNLPEVARPPTGRR